MPNNHTEIEKKLWQTADELRANSKLKASEYSVPVLGLIFLRFADQKFRKAEQELAHIHQTGSRRAVGKADYQGRGVLYLPDKARFSHLLRLPEGADVAQAINEAMGLIEEANEDLRDVLPRNYQVLEKDTLVALLNGGWEQIAPAATQEVALLARFSSSRLLCEKHPAPDGRWQRERRMKSNMTAD